ncbi:thioredoxin family protein [Pedobacter steynii]
MKHLLTIIGIIAVYTAQAQGIKFEENLSWAQIQAKAKAENKYILMDTYATWCGPCKQMSAETFPQKEAGDFINDKFVSVKVQMDQTAVKRRTKNAKAFHDKCENNQDSLCLAG